MGRTCNEEKKHSGKYHITGVGEEDQQHILYLHIVTKKVNLIDEQRACWNESKKPSQQVLAPDPKKFLFPEMEPDLKFHQNYNSFPK